MSQYRVDVLSDASSAISDAGSLDQRLKEIGKSAQQVARETTKGANQTAGSYAKLRQELNSNKKSLEQLEVGSDAFTEQAAVVAELTAGVAEAKDAIAEATKAGEDFESIGEAVAAAEGSVSQLSASLREATQSLNELEPGTEAFERQGQVVAELATDLDRAKTSADEFVNAGKNANKVAPAIKAADNSVESLERNLRDATTELKRLERGTPAYTKQAAEVKKLSKGLDVATKEMKEFTSEDSKVKAMTGSVAQLESELADNVAQMRNLRVGTAEFKKQKDQVDRLARSLDKAKRSFSTGSIGSRVGASVKDFATSIAGFGSIVGGIGAAVGLLKAELAESRRRDAESGVAVRTREQSIAKLVQNAGGTLTDQVVDRAEATATATGTDIDKILAIASSVASAGVSNAEDIVNIAQIALRSQGGDAGQGVAIAGAAIDLSKTLGVSIEQAFGVLFQTAGAARPEDIALLGKAAVKATAALTGAGVSAEEAQELFAASTLLTGDKTGEQAVSISNDLTQALRKFQEEGIPDTIKVAGEDVEVNVPKRFSSLLQGEGLKQLKLDDLLDLTRQSAELEQVFESFLPNGQNRAFTTKIVGGSEAFDNSLEQAADAIDLITAGARTGQQVEAVEGRRLIGGLDDIVGVILDQNLQDQGAALTDFAVKAFDASLARTDNTGVDLVADFAESGFVNGGELFGQGAADARATVLENQVADGRVTGKDAETASQIAIVLRQTQALINAADRGDIGATEAARALRGLRTSLASVEAGNRAVLIAPPERQQPAIQPVQPIEPVTLLPPIGADVPQAIREPQAIQESEDITLDEKDQRELARHEQQQVLLQSQTEAIQSQTEAIQSQTVALQNLPGAIKPPTVVKVEPVNVGPVESPVAASGVE